MGINISSTKLFHILHIDRLTPIINSGELICDNEVRARAITGTVIGMSKIKERRATLKLHSHSDLNVADCVPFYFCPRSVMLYMIYKGNHWEVDYKGGQDPIVHLVLSMSKVVEWANSEGKRWAFTDSNAGSRYFNDYSDLQELDKLNWQAINATNWSACKEQKQAEFLVEQCLPWSLVEEIAVSSPQYLNLAMDVIGNAKHRPKVTVKPQWYY